MPKKKSLPKPKNDVRMEPIIVSVKRFNVALECMSLSEVKLSRLQNALGVHADASHGEDGHSSFKPRSG
ncbi:MAG: hypothetical protein Q7R33_03430 [Nitrosarchaeum sp.]|nr:hypothetical protein [Nitrosarchaeum sp.]